MAKASESLRQRVDIKGPDLIEKVGGDVSRLDSVLAEEAKKHDAPTAWWFVGVFVGFAHLLALYAILFRHTKREIVIFAMIFNWLSGLGITAGYHRLWSHRAYSAALPLRIALMFFATNAFQGSCKWWVLRHRLHHRYTDTEHDPYASVKGFWYSHMGWMFEKPYYPRMKTIDSSDLDSDIVVRLQHKYFTFFMLAIGFVLPAMVGAYFGDWWGGLLWITYVGKMYVWHATWSINSVAHWLGDRLFCDSISARDHIISSLLTNGEGYHNFHHEFPRDYRNGVHWYDYDPTKWAIRLWKWLGLVSKLHRVEKNTLLQSRVQVAERRVARTRARLNWGPNDKDLPSMSLEEFNSRVKKDNLEWILLNDYAVDISAFKSEHPGGSKLLSIYRAKDASKAFDGGMNNHSNSARNIARMLRVARIVQPGQQLAPTSPTSAFVEPILPEGHSDRYGGTDDVNGTPYPYELEDQQ